MAEPASAVEAAMGGEPVQIQKADAILATEGRVIEYLCFIR